MAGITGLAELGSGFENLLTPHVLIQLDLVQNMRPPLVSDVLPAGWVAYSLSAISLFVCVPLAFLIFVQYIHTTRLTLYM